MTFNDFAIKIEKRTHVYERSHTFFFKTERIFLNGRQNKLQIFFTFQTSNVNFVQKKTEMNDTILANALSALTITCSDATAYNTEVLKYRTLKLVLEVAKKIESKNVNIRKAVSGLIVSDYLKIEGVDDNLLLGKFVLGI